MIAHSQSHHCHCQSGADRVAAPRNCDTEYPGNSNPVAVVEYTRSGTPLRTPRDRASASVVEGVLMVVAAAPYW
jgi:hypothetical protein